jgi:hypothetical protein
MGFVPVTGLSLVGRIGAFGAGYRSLRTAAPACQTAAGTTAILLANW